MCGRYSLSGTPQEIAGLFSANVSDEGLWDWFGNYNVSPGMVVPVVAYDGHKNRKLVPMRWGLHPHWRKEPPEGRPLFNARLETAAEKASFRTPFKRRRALIPMDGWYEWEGVERPKTPYYIREAGTPTFAALGLWDKWVVDEGITLLSATIITTSAGPNIKHLHHRMPARLPQENWDDWLDWDIDANRTLDALRSDADLEYWEVSKTVNSGRASGPELIKPAE